MEAVFTFDKSCVLFNDMRYVDPVKCPFRFVYVA